MTHQHCTHKFIQQNMIAQKKMIKWPLATKVFVKNRSINFDPELISVIFGLLLGDASLRKIRSGKSRLWITQSTKHKSFMNFIQNVLSIKGFMHKESLENCARINYRLSSHQTITYDFTRWSFSFAELAYYRELWYGDDKHSDKLKNEKKVPMELYDYLTPICLAIWICGDGSRKNNAMYLHVQGFSITCVHRLQAFLYMKYRIQTSIHYKENRPILYVFSKSMCIVKELVYPYLRSCKMLYKIDSSVSVPVRRRPKMNQASLEANIAFLKNNPKKLVEPHILKELKWLERKLNCVQIQSGIQT